jgi:cell division transport system permease protein
VASFDSVRWRPAPLLPPRDQGGRLLAFVIAVLCFLAGLAEVGALASHRAAEGWKNELIGSATVVVRPSGLESADAAAARAAEVLAGVNGVAEARALDPTQADAMITRFVGPEGLPKDLPVPRLVAVEFKTRAPASVADLRAALLADGVNATVEDHQLWTQEISRVAAFSKWGAVGLVLLIILAIGAMIGWATRQTLEARRQVIEVLHLTGASDGFIGRLFADRFARIAVMAGTIGAAGAALAIIAFRLYDQGRSFTALLPIEWADLAAVIPSPFAAAAVAGLAAGLAAREALGRLS